MNMACQGLCTTKGLTVLPVRYAVVPENIHTALPGWANDPCITGIALGNNEKYTLRALRQGYLYVFYEKGKQGTNYWQCYSVAPDGSLWLQQVASNPAPVDKALCETGEHIAQNVEFMSIESPDKCGNVWFAFSQYPWEQETLDRYRSDTKARSERMQKVMPSVSGSQRTKTGTDVTATSLNQVLDYQVPSVSGLLPGPDDAKVVNVSQVTSLWDPTVDAPWRVSHDVVKMQSSLYPWAKKRSGRVAATVTAMQNRSEGMTPLLLPLWDPVGIVHELNGWSQDVLGRQAQFLQERELEFATKTNLDAVRTLLESNAESLEDAMRRRRTDGPMLTDEYLDSRLQALENRYQGKPDVLAQIRADDRLVRNWHAQNVTASYPESVLMSPPEPLAAHQRRVAAIQAQVDEELALNLPEPSQDFSGVRARSWAPYQKKLNTTRQANFDTCYTSLVDAVNAVFRKRIVSVVNWLSAPVLLATLDDFHCEAQRAGLFYQSAVGMAMHGINSCPAGAAKIDGWWNEYSTKNRGNLLWRHVAANNPQLISELEPYLATVKRKKDEDVTPLTATAMTAALMQQVSNMKKLEGYYQKSMNTVVKGLRENASKLEVQLFNTDAFIVTVGDRVSRILRVDKAGEKLATTAFRLIFMVRAGIPSEKVHSVVNAYLKDAPELRQTVLAGIRSSGRFMANQNEVTAIKQTMSSRLEEHFATEKGKGEYRLAGINSLLLVLNAMDFIYLCGQVREEKKPLSSLMASGLAMVSQGTSVILPAIEKGLEARELTVAWVKGAGAAASGVASLVSVYTDWLSMKAEFQNNRLFLMVVMGGKTFVDVLTVTKSVDLLLEAMSPVVKNMGKKKLAAKMASGAEYISEKLIERYFGVRILAILMTWEAMVAITLLQVVVTWISDDELQVWCKKCVFGTAPFNRSVADQNKALEAAIKDIS
ncbi:T6SS effector BTH_I2691 family protein [Enterobacter cloacae]|uniref:T6SS effector BTH_I2691 family protein n=2 Tax=Enterobacter cloacae TaxID=550 RepID=UPI0011C22D71|nr:T6SS effector BTH_I2691 family protein [Enterobacter cloacae]